MNRLVFLSAALAGLACLGCGAASSDRPNIVLVVVDTLRGDAPLRAELDTPEFDRLAEDGIVFPHAFSHAPMTLPSHTALFSSRPPFRTGVLNNWQEVPSELPLFAEWLQKAGYQTRAVVSLGTLNPRGDEVALDRGFDSYDVDYWHMDLASAAVERIRATLDAFEPDDPFFLFAHFSDPHAPYNDHAGERTATVMLDGETIDQPRTSVMSQKFHSLSLEPGRHTVELRSDEEFRVRDLAMVLPEGGYLKLEYEEGERMKPTLYARATVEVKQPVDATLRYWLSEVHPEKDIPARYIGEVEWMQAHIGALIDELQARGMWDDAIVVFTSDHGEALGERNVYGHVQNLYDEMLHVPLVIKPADPLAHTETLRARSDDQIAHLDLVPTLLDMAGLPPLPGATGVSLFDGRTDVLIAQTHKPEALRDSLCMRDAAFKMIYWPEEDEFEMYDLASDPEEQKDVFGARSGERPGWADQLRGLASIAKANQGGPEASEETQAMLEALGYAGD